MIITKKKNKILQLAFLFVISTTNVFCQWVQTNFPVGFPVQDFIVHKGELHSLIGFTIIKTIDKGETYDLLLTGNGPVNAITSDNTYLYAGSLWQNSVLKTKNGGINWEIINDEILNNGTVTDIITFDSFILFTSFSGASISKDIGRNWDNISFPSAPGNRHIYQSIEKSENRLFIGGTEGLIFHSSDNGQSWNYSKLNTFLSVVSIYNFEGCIYAGTSGDGIFRSCDDGNSWEKINNGLPSNQNIRQITKLNANELVTITNGEIYLWKQEDKMWDLYDTLPFIASRIILFDGYIFAGTFDNGVWRKKIVDNVESNIIPTLSEWGTLIYILLILNISIGILSIKRNILSNRQKLV